MHSSPAAAFVESPLAGRVSGAGPEVNDHVAIGHQLSRSIHWSRFSLSKTQGQALPPSTYQVMHQLSDLASSWVNGVFM